MHHLKKLRDPKTMIGLMKNHLNFQAFMSKMTHKVTTIRLSKINSTMIGTQIVAKTELTPKERYLEMLRNLKSMILSKRCGID